MQAGKNISIGLTLDGRDFAVQLKNVDGLLKQFRGSLTTTSEDVKKVSGHLAGAGSGFRGFMLMAASARFALMDFHDVFLRLPLAVIKTAGEMERMTKLMEGLSTAADKVGDATKSKNFVFALAQNAPFEVKALTDSFIKLKTGGIDPMDGSLQALTDSVAKFGGSSEQLHRASVAIQQMGGKGVISMEELRQQLGEAVPNAIQMMAMGVGKSMADLTKAISNGEVEAKSALKRMFAMMEIENLGASAKMMNTWTGMMSQLQTKWTLFQNQMAGGENSGGVFSEARKEVQLLLDAFDGSIARKFGADLSEVMYELASAMSSAINTVVKYYDEVKTLLEIIAYGYGATKLSAMYNSAKATYTALSLAASESAAAHVLSEEAKTAASITSARAEAALASQKTEALAQELLAKQSYVAKAKAQNLDLMIQEKELEAVVTSRRVKGRFASAEFIAEKERELVALRQMRAAFMENIAVVDQDTVAMRVNVVTTQALVAEKRALVVAMEAGGVAAAGAGKTMAGLGGVFSALGGWLTVATVAIMGAVWAWEKFGNSAEKNLERARRAAKGMSLVGDDVAQDADIKTSEGKIRGLNAAIANPLFASSEATNRLLLAKEEENLKKLKDGRKEIKASLDESEYADWSQGEDRKTKKKIDEYAANYDRELSALQLTKNEKLKQLEDSGKKDEAYNSAKAKIESEYAKSASAAFKKEKMEEVALWESELKRLEGDISNDGNLEKNARKIAEATTKLNNAKAAALRPDVVGTDYVHMKGKGAGSKATGPKIGGLEDQILAAQTELRNAQSLNSRLSGEIDRAAEIDKEVKEKWEKMLAEGKLTKLVPNGKGGKKAESIGSIGKDGSVNIADKKDREKYEEGQAAEAAAKKIEAANKATATSVAALAKETEDYNFMLENSGEFSEFVDTKSKQLSASYEKEKASLKGLNTELLDKTQAERQSIAASQAALSYQQRIAQESSKLDIDLTVNSQDKIQKEYALTTRRIDAEYTARRTQLLASLSEDEFATIATNERILALEKAHNKQMGNAAKQLAWDTKTPLEKLGEQWANITDNMQQSSVSWANGFMDQMTKLVTTGKADFKSLVASILADTARMKLQEAVSGSGALGWIGKLATMAIGAVTGTSSVNVDAIPVLGDAPMASNLVDPSAFANGGIMTEFGPVALRKYANGGIANSPQLAYYGEGSMNEAYVPLPDGRSIPVTMQGGSGGQMVNISIVVNKDGSESTASDDSDGSWRQVAEKIKVVVRDELVTQQRPGGMLYK